MTIEQLCRALREQRKARGYSQAQLSTMAGVPQPQISMIESGKRLPTPKTIDALLLALGLTIELLPIDEQQLNPNSWQDILDEL